MKEWIAFLLHPLLAINPPNTHPPVLACSLATLSPADASTVPFAPNFAPSNHADLVQLNSTQPHRNTKMPTSPLLATSAIPTQNAYLDPEHPQVMPGESA